MAALLRRRLPLLAGLLLGLLAAGGVRAAEPAAPEGASGRQQGQLARARTHMIAAANPVAVEAGLGVLRAGGSAADAAIVVQLVLNLVEPQSSGLGGGAFVLAWSARDRRLLALDGREAAPAGATPDQFMRAGRPWPYPEAVLSGRAVGAPGTLRLLEDLHRRLGRLPWADLLAVPIRLAEDGFAVSPRLHHLLSQTRAETFAPRARAYFYDGAGSARPVGHRLRNPEFAATLRAIAAQGVAHFYEGTLADEIAAAVQGSPRHPGSLTRADLAAYRVVEREPLCFPYRALRICSVGAPSSGGLALAQVLGLVEPFALGTSPADAMNGAALHVIVEAEKLAYADRDRYVADPAFFTAPHGLLAAGYLAQRRSLIAPGTAMPRPAAGRPADLGLRAVGEDATLEQAGTTHFSIVDRDGDTIAFTSTIEAGFGSRLWAGGFLLNNELTDFSFRPHDAAGAAIANAIAPLKRPRSSMAPTIVFDGEGRPIAALGSVGGARIPLYVVKTLVALIDWKLDAQAATALTNFGSRGGAVEIEIDEIGGLWHALKLKPFGHRITVDPLTSGTHVIVRRPDGSLEGGADPRREGIARGD